MSQTTVQRQNAIRFGSAKFEIGDNLGALTDIGALRNVKAIESWDELLVESGNAGVLLKKIKNQKLTISADYLEPDMTALNIIRGGIDTYSTVAGVLVNNAIQTVVSGDWEFNTFIPFIYANATGLSPNIDSVTGSTDGLLVAETDYFISQDAQGRWGIFIKDSVTVTTEAQNMVIQMDYTPAASKKLSSGGKFTIDSKVIRLTNTNEAGNEIRIVVYNAYNSKALELNFPDDNADDVMVVPVSLIAEVDATRAAGDQLYEITDEQSTT
jgi:hypothetical protein